LRSKRAKQFGWFGLEGVTRGSNRRDIPTSGSSWIDYSCPIETWEYWQGKDQFGQEFSPALRSDIARALFDFRNYQKSWEVERIDRLDAKQIIRGLKAAEKTGECSNSKLQRFININCLNMPDTTLIEKAGYLLKEFAANADDFTMERPQPRPYFTCVLYEILQRHGHNVSLGSVGVRYSMSKEAREDDPLETAFIEFVRRCLWGADRSLKFCARVQKVIQRHAARSSL
jgi:hypothetical protein